MWYAGLFMYTSYFGARAPAATPRSSPLRVAHADAVCRAVAAGSRACVHPFRRAVLFGKLFADKYLKSPPPKNPLYKAAKKAATLQGGAANGKASVNGNGKASARASKDDKKHK